MSARPCLMAGMEATLGVDLGASDVDALLGSEALAEMAARCDACTKHDACVIWLLENDTAQATPGYCRNSEEFAALRAQR